MPAKGQFKYYTPRGKPLFNKCKRAHIRYDGIIERSCPHNCNHPIGKRYKFMVYSTDHICCHKGCCQLWTKQ